MTKCFKSPTSDLCPTSEIVEENWPTDKKNSAVLKEDECEEDSVIGDSACLRPHHGRSRIGTETSVENPTCIENPGNCSIQLWSLFVGKARRLPCSGTPVACIMNLSEQRSLA